MLRAERWDPEEWAALFAAAGDRYVVPVAEHHDGFAMYDCSLSEWTAVKLGPKRDIVGELAEAVRQQGLTLGVSSHRAEHWGYFDGGMRFDSDVQDRRYFGLYGPAQPGPTDPYSLDEALQTRLLSEIGTRVPANWSTDTSPRLSGLTGGSSTVLSLPS
jgi:alpha-L-fucosidase